MRARRGGGLGAEIKAPASEMVCLALTMQLDAAERRDLLRHTDTCAQMYDRSNLHFYYPSRTHLSPFRQASCGSCEVQNVITPTVMYEAGGLRLSREADSQRNMLPTQSPCGTILGAVSC